LPHRSAVPSTPPGFTTPAQSPDVLLGAQPFSAEVIDDEASRTRLWELADRVLPAFAVYWDSAGGTGRINPILQLVPR